MRIFFLVESGFKKCPPTRPKFKCEIDPCEDKICFKYPKAVCYANYCGSCSNYVFKFKKRIVNCDNLAFVSNRS
ncbi:unnamed protein product [Gordionus sp. m RMFG-2023]